MCLEEGMGSGSENVGHWRQDVAKMDNPLRVGRDWGTEGKARKNDRVTKGQTKEEHDVGGRSPAASSGECFTKKAVGATEGGREQRRQTYQAIEELAGDDTQSKILYKRK